MKRVISLFVVSFFLFIDSFACVQGLQELNDGTVISIENDNLVIPKGNTLVHQDGKVLRRLDSLWNAKKDIKYLSDYAMVLVINGNYEEAKNSYLKLEKIKPDQYATASNLGTVYELLGDNKNALTWIQKALQLNPSSHDSSEWLHVRILEAKIGGDKFINTNFLLHTDFGRDSMPASELTKAELQRLRSALFYQLNERLTFVHSQDKIVAQLLFDLANVSLLIGMDIYQVNDIYSMAKKYGYSSPLWEARHITAKKLSEKINRGQVEATLHGEEVQTPQVDFPWAVILGICFFIFPVLMFFYLKFKMNGKTKYFIYKKK
jgi:tetratricopeptide (TPR) repeat protein